MRKPVSVEMQVAVTLYYLADEGRFHKVANAFGLAVQVYCVSNCLKGVFGHINRHGT